MPDSQCLDSRVDDARMAEAFRDPGAFINVTFDAGGGDARVARSSLEMSVGSGPDQAPRA